MDRVELLISYSQKVAIHRRMWEAEWNRRNSTGVSYSQFAVLRALDEEGPKQSKDLVQQLSITSGGITTIANKLLEQRLISRTRGDQADGRAITLEITEQGRAILTSLKIIQHNTFEKMFSALTFAEIAFLEQIYDKLIQGKQS